MQEAQKKEKRQTAWQPLTPGGVASFAQTTFLRVITFQFFFAALNALTFAWFLQTSWTPVVRLAIDNLPVSGEITRGMLVWGGPSPVLLAHNSNLALVVDLLHTGQSRVPSDILVEFGHRDLRVYSLFGFVELEYPAGWRVAMNRAETAPWFGAWGPPALWLLVLSCVVVLLVGWAFLAAVYAWIAWLVAFFANRDTNLGKSWRLASAALMPASLVLWLGIVLYGTGAMNLVGFLMMLLGHLATGGLYTFLAPLALSREASAPKKGNPFVKGSK
jgi:hypothetical protein